MGWTDLGQSLLNELNRCLPVTFPVGDVQPLEAEPTRGRARIPETVCHGQTASNGLGGRTHVSNDRVARKQVVVTTQAFGGADSIRDLDALFEVLYTVRVAEGNASDADVVQRV